jgi:hypothetical protein
MNYPLLKQLTEGVLDDIIADMVKNGELNDPAALRKRMASGDDELQPERHSYTQEHIDDGFKKYIYEQELADILKEKLGTTEITIENIGRLYAGWKICLRDNITLPIEVEELINHREWDRRQHAQPRNNQKEMAELKASMAKGIRADGHGIIDVKMTERGFDTWVSEGNHRALIAKELGITHLPMRFYYK